MLLSLCAIYSSCGVLCVFMFFGLILKGLSGLDDLLMESCLYMNFPLLVGLGCRSSWVFCGGNFREISHHAGPGFRGLTDWLEIKLPFLDAFGGRNNCVFCKGIRKRWHVRNIFGCQPKIFGNFRYEFVNLFEELVRTGAHWLLVRYEMFGKSLLCSSYC